MPVGTMSFPLHLGKIPEGMTFTVTGVKPVVPAGDWYAYTNLAKFPHVVDTSGPNPLIGGFSLSTTGITQHGSGPYFEVSFTVSGKSPNGVESSRDGHLTISTSDWGFIERPDQGIITFGFDGSAAHTHMFDTPTLRYLNDVHLLVEYFPSETAVGMTVTSDATMISKICDVALGGIFLAHEKAASWAVGKVW
ncbi:hypothetical protein BZA05DRAFT_475196 [Tricharina praecox]|uniref:uncharacterized protein n=1 Tax=Tricharina praecox TaxID=43433 RepID=UPI00221F5641|nr:uncharacterized protein BZA05DRAFT_475196 [Tricharina praecox]KAI5848876.1 hypothetical protein BZA05DRAFT_475196 [Tricharina praecox]